MPSRAVIRDFPVYSKSSEIAIEGRRGTVVSTSVSFSAMSLTPVVALSKKLYPHCLVLVCSRNGFKRDLHKLTLFVQQSY